ncbi:MAG: hypothetical protein LUE98_07135 [Tannerellaceae bacterium]|nr:hypothetical protein [Tannerellaceae bacterium]
MKKIGFILISCLFTMASCINEVDIDSIIQRVENNDISPLNGIYVGAMGVGDLTTEYYLVGKANPAGASYGVTVNRKDWNKMEIHRHMLDPDMEDYLGEETIQKAVLAYLKLRVYRIIVFEDGEIYIPLNVNRSIELMRKSSEPSEERNYNDFEHYKDNWYIKRK